MRIGIDLMGSSIIPSGAASAIKEALEVVDAHIHIFATSEIAHHLKNALQDSITIEVLEDYIRMDEPSVRAVMDKQNSTLVRSIKALEQGEIDALVTLGSTGAVIGSARFYLPSLTGVRRPFLLASMPSLNGPLLVADVGGTVLPKLTHFKDLAKVTSAYFKAQNEGVPIRLGLLNIGEEATKGTGVHKDAFYYLNTLVASMAKDDATISFVGNIEPHNAFNGSVNVLVTDGFTGNIFLKTAEGTAEFIFKYLGNSSHKSFESSTYSGAFVAGVDAVLVKCHGHSTKKALLSGIEQASNALKNKLLSKVKAALV